MTRLVILFLLTFSSTFANNNVCKHLQDYLTIDTNPNCWYNPDVGADTEDIIKNRGYPFESYDVITEDGYIITLYRIPHNNVDPDRKRQPVLLQTGLSGSSCNWFALGNNSLPFVLVNNGYDVWISNIRGTKYAKGHTKLSQDSLEFWDYSFHEIALYDLKAEIETVANITKMPGKIILLSYSMGSTESFIYSSIYVEHAKKNLAGIVALTPVAYMSGSKGLFKLLSYFSPFLKSLAEKYGLHVLNHEKNEKSDSICTKFPYFLLCNIFIGLADGFDTPQLRYEDLPVYYSKPASATSAKILIHYDQIVWSGKFQQFDYGDEKNLELYNSTVPPEYNISKIAVPVHLIYGSGDYISTAKDVKRLYKELKTPEKSIMEIGDGNMLQFNHNDFMVAKDIDDYFYKPLLALLREKLNKL